MLTERISDPDTERQTMGFHRDRGNGSTRSAKYHTSFRKEISMGRRTLFLRIALVSVILQVCSVQSQEVLRIALKRVPDVAGLSEKRGLQILDSLGIGYQKIYITARTAQYEGKKGTIVKQYPEAGSNVSSRQKVSVYVYSPVLKPVTPVTARTPAKVSIPDIDLQWKGRFFFKKMETLKYVLVATLANRGRHALPGRRAAIQVQLSDADNHIIYDSTEELPLVPANGVYPVNLSPVPRDVFNNTALITLTVNPDKAIAETVYDNNTLSERNLPDLRISRIWLEHDGDKYTVKASVSNVGPRPMPGSFSMTWTINDKEITPLIYRVGQGPEIFLVSLNESQVPEDMKTIAVRFHVNDGRATGGRIVEELGYENNVMEAELDIPGR